MLLSFLLDCNSFELLACEWVVEKKTAAVPDYCIVCLYLVSCLGIQLQLGRLEFCVWNLDPKGKDICRDWGLDASNRIDSMKSIMLLASTSQWLNFFFWKIDRKFFHISVLESCALYHFLGVVWCCAQVWQPCVPLSWLLFVDLMLNLKTHQTKQRFWTSFSVFGILDQISAMLLCKDFNCSGKRFSGSASRVHPTIMN